MASRYVAGGWGVGCHELDRPSARRARLTSDNMKIEHEDRKVFVPLLYHKLFSIDSG